VWAILLSFTPVREVIHSSLVSRMVDRSSFVNIEGGAHMPQPVISIPTSSSPFEEPLVYLYFLDTPSRS